MLIRFSVKNFRSFKEKQVLDLAAGNAEYREENVYCPKKGLRLLKSAVIYGANASGKTNLVRAFQAMHEFVVNSIYLKNGDLIGYHDPFKLDAASAAEPCEFEVLFLGDDGIQYEYQASFNKKEVLGESLDFFPNNRRANIFSRSFSDIKLGKAFTDKRAAGKVLPNRLFLTEAGNSGHKQLGDIYLAFRKMEVCNLLDDSKMKALTQRISEAFADKDQADFKHKLTKLLRVADTKIESVEIFENAGADSVFNPVSSPFVASERIAEKKYRLKAQHKMHSEGVEAGFVSFDFEEESEGTKVLYALGGLILQTLEKGGIVFFDELNNSLHPRLSLFLVKLFHNAVSNPKNAQLVFATHEITLLDKGLFRKEQIWFTEKDNFGESSLFSARDFDGVKDNVPFGQWYMQGKFGGQPKIKETEFIFGG